MRKFLLVLLVVLWPTTAKATLFTYDISLTILAANLQQPLYGDIGINVFFTQDTQADSPYYAPSLPRELLPKFGVRTAANTTSMFWGLAAASLNDIRFGISDFAGFVVLDLFYDAAQVFNAPFREPDRLGVTFGYELGSLPGMPGILGTGGSQIFNQGEFSFERSHVEVVEPSALVLIACGLLLMSILKFVTPFHWRRKCRLRTCARTA